MSAIYDKVPVLLFLVLFAPGAAGAEQSGGIPPKPIEASLIVTTGQEPVHVGQEVTARIILRNTTYFSNWSTYCSCLYFFVYHYSTLVQIPSAS